MVTFVSSLNSTVDENVSGIVYDADTDGEVGTVTYTLGGADAGLFTIDSATGHVSLITGGNFEVDAQYSIDITATDSGDLLNPETQTVLINIADVNEAPTAVVYTPGVTTFSETATTATKTLVGTYAVTDDSKGFEAVTLTGADASMFFASNGGIYLKAGSVLDFEANPNLEVTININDSAFPLVTKSTPVSIAVTDVDPILVTSPLPDVVEGTAFVANVVDPAGDTDSITYGISNADPDGALFQIDSAGNLSFINAPDRENPLDTGGDNNYVVTVTAKDGATGNTVATQYNFDVTDLNDTAPIINSSATVGVNENSTAVTTVTSTDPDLTGGPTTYSISGADSALFNIDTNTGVLTFIGAPDHETPGDAGANNVYNIIVTASDGTNTSNQNMTITVNDLNDNAPVITSLATASVSENQTAAYDANATDADTVGGPITYSIAGGADQALFSIDSSTGVVTFNSAPNFEAPGDSGGNNVYDIVVEAKDAGGNSDTQAVAITVTDVNDNVPVFTSSATATVDENQTAVLTATTSDADTVGTIPATFSITGGADATKFAITSAGVLTFISAPDFEAKADAGGNNVYDVQITANDGTNTTVQNVAVTLTDLNDSTPVFTSPTTKIANENQTSVMTVTTSDADTVGTIPATFTITGGADMALFSITAGGVLTFLAAPDFETKADAGTNGVYDVEVTANDGTNTTVQNIAVTVGDVNEAPTAVGVTISTPSVSEGVSTSSAILIGNIAITDDALGTENVTLSGADASLLEIVGSSIYIKAGAILDFEAAGGTQLNFVVDVTDPALGGSVSSSAQVVNVTNAIPVLVSSVGNIVENTTAVANVVGVGGDRSGISYGIANSDDGALFQVDAAGNLSFIAAPDFESPLDIGADNGYTVTVTANDGNGGLVATTYNFSVTDASEAPINGTNGDDTLNGTNSADTINGLDGRDTINGLDGNDIINGGKGRDTMNGGDGNDTYSVDNSTDIVNESAGQGTDTVNSNVNYVLSANVENLTLQGSANINGTGNADANILIGTSGNNILSGLGGADTIRGGLGKDTMTGGTGNDTFDFNAILESRARPNHDIITDFTNGDIIDLGDIAGLTAVAGQGGVVANSVSWALDGADTIISVETTGDGIADMEIQLNGNQLGILDAGDFII
jgi:Ca2+-binding RTX toxin-like protein